jgi:hypothetical protein
MQVPEERYGSRHDNDKMFGRSSSLTYIALNSHSVYLTFLLFKTTNSTSSSNLVLRDQH